MHGVFIIDEKAIGTWGQGGQLPPLRRKRAMQYRRNYFDNVNYTVFHKTIIFTIVWLSMTMTECMFSFNLQCLNNFRKSLEIDDLIVNLKPV